MTVISRSHGRNKTNYRSLFKSTSKPYFILINGLLLIALIFVVGANINFANASVSMVYQVGDLNDTFNVVSSGNETLEDFDVTMYELMEFAESHGMVRQADIVTLNLTATPSGLALSN